MRSFRIAIPFSERHDDLVTRPHFREDVKILRDEEQLHNFSRRWCLHIDVIHPRRGGIP
jgi:hypothetical protein